MLAEAKNIQSENIKDASVGDAKLTTQSLVGDLPLADFCIGIKEMGELIEDTFKKNKHLPGILVMENDSTLCGMISRQRFLELISKPFRQELYRKKPIHILVKYNFDTPFILPASMRIEQAAILALDRDKDMLYEPIVIEFPESSPRLLDTHTLLHSLTLIADLQFQELQRTQKSLIQTEKLASLGGLVAGIAHEVNTPIGIGLTAITHFVERLEKFSQLYKSGKMTKSDLEKIVEVANESGHLILNNLTRAADLVQSFKQVAVDQTSEKSRVFNLSRSIHEILLSLHPMYKHTDIKINVDCSDKIELDSFPGPFAQVLSNLVLNALIHGFGETTTGNISINAKDIGKNRIEVCVADDGRGIPREIISKIFEPFFTTRRGSGGSGLGLHIVYSLVTTKLGGSIECISELGKGTKFIFILTRVLSTVSKSNILEE